MNVLSWFALQNKWPLLERDNPYPDLQIRVVHFVREKPTIEHLLAEIFYETDSYVAGNDAGKTDVALFL